MLISVEDIEDDEAKAKEVVFMEEFAKRVREVGIEKAWEPILVDLSPVIRSMVTEAIPRSNPESIAAAASIGYDQILSQYTRAIIDFSSDPFNSGDGLAASRRTRQKNFTGYSEKFSSIS